jgi:hypothetical protein
LIEYPFDRFDDVAGRLDDWDQGALEAVGPGAWREYQRTLKWMRSFER